LQGAQWAPKGIIDHSFPAVDGYLCFMKLTAYKVGLVRHETGQECRHHAHSLSANRRKRL